MTRNTFQVLGKNLVNPSKFILCWTPNGKITGGTGQALRIAEHFEIPIINMYFENWFNELLEIINNEKEE